MGGLGGGGGGGERWGNGIAFSWPLGLAGDGGLGPTPVFGNR